MTFKDRIQRLTPFTESILLNICPGGKRHGGEYIAGSINGGPGRSFSFNLQTGLWADFATGEKGSDIVALYALAKGLSMGDAMSELEKAFLGKPTKHNYPVAEKKPAASVIKPPHNAKPPSMNRNGLQPSQIWTYKDTQGDPLFYIARFDKIGPDGNPQKDFYPFTFSSKGQWIAKQWPAPRPLYNLDKLAKDTKAPVLIVEGEKACDAAEKLLNGTGITCCTWSGGANAVNKTDFSPLHNRRVLLWPDADSAGVAAMAVLAKNLERFCPTIKVIHVDRDDGWDAADALNESDFNFQEWARKHAVVYHQKEKPEVLKPAESKGELTYEKALLLPNLLLTVNKQGMPKIICNEFNVIQILTEWCEEDKDIWLNTFDDDIYTNIKTKDQPEGDVRVIDDATCEWLLQMLQGRFMMTGLKIQNIRLSLRTIASKKCVNPVREMINEIKWDGEKRLETFLHRVTGCDDNTYSQTVSKNFLIGMIARIYSPGCQMDNMLILEGPQGFRKSTFAKEIFDPRYYGEIGSDVDKKDFQISLRGKVAVENAELSRFHRAETTMLKSKITATHDDYRPPYGVKNKSFPRTCVFIGTTNEDEYLRDETGNRRYWPVRVKKIIDIELLRAEREQIWAEALHRFKSGEKWHVDYNFGVEEQAARDITDIWQEIIERWVVERMRPSYTTPSPSPWFTYADVMNALGIDTAKMDGRNKGRVGSILRKMGYVFKKNCMRDGITLSCFEKGKAPELTESGGGSDERVSEYKKKEIINYASPEMLAARNMAVH